MEATVFIFFMRPSHTTCWIEHSKMFYSDYCSDSRVKINIWFQSASVIRDSFPLRESFSWYCYVLNWERTAVLPRLNLAQPAPKLLHKLPHMFCLSRQAWPVISWYSTHPVSSRGKHHPIITVLPQAIMWFPVWNYQHVAKHRISFLIFFKFNCIVNKGVHPYRPHGDLWTFSMSWNIN